MSQSHVAAGRYVTGQSFPEVRSAAGRCGPWAGFRVGVTGAGVVTTVENLITYLQGYGAQV